MSKVGSSSSPSARARRSYWVRRTVSPFTGERKTASPKKPRGKRFVEPYRLSDEQRLLMLAPLSKLSIGDDESRSLFAAALEYDLASCRGLTEPEKESPPAKRPPESKEDAALAAVAATAESLASGLEGLNDATSRRLQEQLEAADRFQRRYDEGYLKSLGCELRRIAGIGRLSKLAPSKESREHAVSEDARRFILRAADAFEACFELTTDTQPDSRFVAAVEAIVAATGIRVPTDRTILAQILNRA